MNAHTKKTQEKMLPKKSLTALKDGNRRFQKNFRNNRDLVQQMKDTGSGQYPFATILSCIDSRVSAEIVFDQGIGDIFSARVAGNVINEDILGSIEFACKLAGTQLLVVMGHTSCGAVKGACDHAEMGNLTALLNKIQPAVKAVKKPASAKDRTSKNLEFVNEVAETNVHLTIKQMRKDSPILAEMEKDGDLLIVGAMYDIHNGKVTFFD